jgi:ABC-type multidrug transport system fused ATPase/permease subunit
MWGYYFAEAITGLASLSQAKIAARFESIALQFLWLAAIAGLSEYFRVLIFSRMGERQIAGLKQLYLRSVLRQDLAWHELDANAAASTRLSTHLPKLKAMYGIPMSQVFVYSCKALVALIIGLWASWQLMLTLLTMLPVIWVSFKVFGRLRNQNSVRSSKAYLQASRVSDEIVSLLDTIRAFCSFNIELDRSEPFFFALFRSFYVADTRRKSISPARQSDASTLSAVHRSVCHTCLFFSWAFSHSAMGRSWSARESWIQTAGSSSLFF